MSDGAYTESLSDLVMQQWTYNSTLYSECLKTRFSAEEGAALRQRLAYLTTHRGGKFHLAVPGSDPELTLSLNSYPVDFPFGMKLPENKLWDFWEPAQLKKLTGGISCDDEAWFGDDYDYAYVHTPVDSTKSILFLIKDGSVSGIELINGLDGAIY